VWGLVTTLFDEAAHIKSGRPGGPRYDPNQIPEECCHFDNLILLCGVHHKCVAADSGPLGSSRRFHKFHGSVGSECV
jgi:hypothetical protein